MGMDAPNPPPPLFLSTQEGYDRWSALYDDEGNPLLPLEEPQVRRALGDVAGLSLLDVGCGTGRHALRCAEAGAQVTALDFSSGMLEKARSKPGAANLTFIAHDLTQPLPFSAAQFDRALCCLVLDHIPRPVDLFSEIHRVLRPGGFLIASMMHPALMLRGVQARYTEPATGQKVHPQSYPHRICEYVMAAAQTGFAFIEMSEHDVTPALAEKEPRAERYVGWPMLLLFKLQHVADRPRSALA